MLPARRIVKSPSRLSRFVYQWAMLMSLFGPSICGNVSYWPTGSLGNSTTESDLARFMVDSQYSQAAVNLDETMEGALIEVCEV
jgi:hypothetical protein